MPAAALRAAPMPPPMSRYQLSPDARDGCRPTARHRRFSSASVPLLSPRDTKDAWAAAIVRSAARASWPPATWAGSAAGPTITKSFQAICRRSPPWPSAMNLSSASGSWTNTMSASPRAAVASAWPVPWAMTRIETPVSAVNFGKRTSSRPESCNDVVEAMTIACDCACAPSPLVANSTPTNSAARCRSAVIASPPRRAQIPSRLPRH